MPYADPDKRRRCAAETSRRYRAKKHAERYGAEAGDQRGRHGNHLRGSDHPRWNEGRILSEHGYVKVRVGTDHPLADPNGYAYEHLVVWASAGRTLPGPDEILHHKDENKTNNRLDNLEKLTRSQHGSLHIGERDRDAAGRLLDGRTWDELPHSLDLKGGGQNGVVARSG
jgi:hypothetical protein